MTLPQPAIPVLAGYRLVRKLGEGSRAQVYLGAAVSDRSDSPRVAALKVFRPELSRHEIGTELAALARVDLSHCVRLLDLATAPGGLPVPILGRVQRGSLAQLLRDREFLEPGEAVTLLAPLPATMLELHRLGVAHANWGASSVHFGAAGEPVLLGFGHASLFEAGLSVAALDDEPAVAGDRDGLAALAEAVLGRVRQTGGALGVRDLLDWLAASAGVRRFEFAVELQERLFDLAEALPIEFARTAGQGAVVPARIGEPVVADPGVPTSPTTRTPRGAPIVARLQDAILSSPLVPLRRRLGAALRGVRKPLWIVAGAVAAALVLAVALIPQGDGQTAARGAQTPVPTPSAVRSALPDDPVRALPLLLSAREGCIRDISVLCLDAVDEPSSAALDDDTALIRRIQSGEEVPASANLAAPAPALTERLGDSALVELDPESGPASALMIREEAGWRIREFLQGKPVQP